MEEYLEIGQIVNTNGLKGLLKIKPFTDDITRFEDLEFIYIQKGQELIKANRRSKICKEYGITKIRRNRQYR